jgi:hypothetical protein
VVEEKINCTVMDVELQSSKLYLKEKIENTWSKLFLLC